MSEKEKVGGNSNQSDLAQCKSQIYCRNQTTEQHEKADRAIHSYDLDELFNIFNQPKDYKSLFSITNV